MQIQQEDTNLAQGIIAVAFEEDYSCSDTESLYTIEPQRGVFSMINWVGVATKMVKISPIISVGRNLEVAPSDDVKG